MNNNLWNFIRLGSAAVGACLLMAGNAVAEPIKPLVDDPLTPESDSIEQITNVSELRDVQPTDWAFEALRNLVERYGCIVGYPDQTYRGNKALSRYEFAAGVSACLDQIERLIAQSQSVLQEDIEALQRLAQEFEAELAAISGRVDNLEGRVAFLEDNQFSTTTKLTGEVIMAASQVFGEENAATGEDLDVQATLNQRTRLVLDSSFTGEDKLRIRLQAANFDFARGGSNMTDLNFSADTDNDIILNKLFYSFPVGDKTRIWIGGAGMTPDDVADPVAPFTNSFTEGALAYFTSIAPLYSVAGGAGAAVSYNFTDSLNLVGYYSASTGGRAEEGAGLFNGQYVAHAQLTYTFSPGTAIGLVYSNQYIPSGIGESVLAFAGTNATNDPFFGRSNGSLSNNIAIVGSWRIAPKFSIEGWAMYTNAEAQGGSRDGDTADIWNAKLSFALIDLFKESNVGVLSVGIPPFAPTIEGGGSDADMPVMIELFYVYNINDNISITPGFIVAINPESGRDPLYEAVVRGSFKF